MEKFIVTVSNGGEAWYLRATVWTGEVDRASRFATREAAQKALDAAKKFMKARIYKAAAIVPEPDWARRDAKPAYEPPEVQ